MKILILSDSFPPRIDGGPAVVASELALSFVKEGHTVMVVTTVRKKEYAQPYSYHGIPVSVIYSDYHWRWNAYRSLYRPFIAWKLKKIFDEFKPDVVHAHNIHFHLSYHSLKLAKKSGAKVVLTAHDCMLFQYGKFSQFIQPNVLDVPTHFEYRVSPWDQFLTYKRRYNPFRNMIIKQYLKYCDHICAVSGRLREALEANGIHGSEVMYNGIDTHMWKPGTRLDILENIKKRFGLHDKKVILFVGRLSSDKGGEQVIHALKRICDVVPDTLLVAVGKKDEYAEKMKNVANGLGVGDRLIVTGWLVGEELRAIYEVANVVVFPSVCFDTFGMVSIEAMAMEKPVVATCFGGSPEVVENGVTGVIVNPLNVAMLASAVTGFLVDTHKAEAFGVAGRSRVERLFTLAIQVKKYLSIFNT